MKLNKQTKKIWQSTMSALFARSSKASRTANISIQAAILRFAQSRGASEEI